MPLTSVYFVCTTGFLLSIAMVYIFLGWIIFRRWKYFKCSFFRIYLVATAVNLTSICVQFMTYRLPFHTCSHCLLADFFRKKHFFGMEVINFLYVHCSIVQYNICLILSFNRLHSLYYPSSCEKKWRNMFFSLSLLAVCAPLIIDYPLIRGQSFYQFVDKMDMFQTRSTAYSNELFNGVIVYSGVITTINLILNVLMASYLISKRDREIKSSERKLCIMTTILFCLQFFNFVRSILWNIYNDHEQRNSLVNRLLLYMEPIFLDLMVSFPPIILVLCSRIIQRQIHEIFFAKDKIPLASQAL
ncbi:unnamed protein product [Auanema sp. JU1783]|nr:unnamed protein product [Auanema sp. JU1783]